MGAAIVCWSDGSGCDCLSFLLSRLVGADLCYRMSREIRGEAEIDSTPSS